MNHKNKVMYISFKDIIDDDNCVVKSDGKKDLISRETIMTRIRDDLAAGTVIIKQKDQWFVDPFYYGGILTGIDVYKFIVLLDNGDKIIIKNVSETDMYFNELSGFAKYKVKVLSKNKVRFTFDDDMIYPDFLEESDYEYHESDDKKR